MANGQGGARIGAGRKKKALADNIADGNPGKRKLTVLDFTDCAAGAQLANVSMVEDFITGFRMGAQIMMAVLLPDSQSPEQIGKVSRDE